MSRFFTKPGWLTSYAMACGYMHVTCVGNVQVSLSSCNPSLNTFDVKAYDGCERLLWETVDGVTAARELYALEIRKLGGKVATRSRMPYEPADVPSIIKA